MFKLIWDWLDGNKTLLGTMVLAILGTGVISDHTFAYAFLQWLGNFMVGGGLVHKLAKGTRNTGK